VTGGDRSERDERNGDEHSCESAQLDARQHGEHDRQRMQVNTATDQPRIDHVILDDTNDHEIAADPHGEPRHLQRCDDDRDGGDEQRADEWHEFQNPSEHAEQRGVRHAQQRETATAHGADEHARQDLTTDVRSEGRVEVFRELVTARA